MRRPAVFLDRDGTMNVKPAEHEYVTTLEEFAWLPGARSAIARFANAGYVVAVVSNQRGVARRIVHPSVLAELELRIQNDLAPYGCAIGAFRYCPHDTDAGCGCRKPAPGMILALAEELDLDLSRSWMVGDAESDVRAGHAAGCRTALIGSPGNSVSADLVVRSLDEASRKITSTAPAPQPDRV
jgi:D-glycero-D-manno-heptose 1,7-bisphosphate phosphatase